MTYIILIVVSRTRYFQELAIKKSLIIYSENTRQNNSDSILNEVIPNGFISL